MAEKRGLSGAALKWAALVSMLLDHTGAVLVYDGWIGTAGVTSVSRIVYILLRSVGRLAFPLFCFLLTEGFFHTRSRGRYLLRLLLFALLSELPFDLAFNGAVLEFTSQNVFLTLVLGLLAVWAWQSLTERGGAWRVLPAVCAAAVCAAAAWRLETDYGAFGVALILVFYLLRARPWLRDAAAVLVLAAMVKFGGSWWIELFGALSLVAVRLYNGERGRQSKWFFYVFYPAHLLLLFALRPLLWG